MKKGNCIIFLIFAVTAAAQQVVTTAGGSQVQSNGSSSWTLGEVSVETYKSTTGTATQGMQQPSLQIVAHSSTTNLNIQASVYPNPTSNSIQLILQEIALSNITYSIGNSSGIQLLNGKIEMAESIIDLGALPAATYLLKILNNGIEQKSFKIIKQ
ncbi:MAG TPA: T9SS type A sorting domain-containing protein [Cytophagales bacterium]|nr:T9SS type A sorting domain-containing protein [Cytophagales bacterium]